MLKFYSQKSKNIFITFHNKKLKIKDKTGKTDLCQKKK